ncbi:MAG TPA: alpha-glucosidase C-terminal domain-containing protein, partial [Rhizobiaceae bacterium]|nr:alpha-glucosidase C-terminal domain-containing protein [Rhizobiaceae bacterium]
EIRFLSTEDDILAYLREWRGERILCVFSFAREEREFGLGDFAGVKLMDAPGFTVPAKEGKRLRLEGLGAAFGIVE